MGVLDQLWALQLVDVETDEAERHAAELRAKIANDHALRELEHRHSAEAQAVKHGQLRVQQLESDVEATAERVQRDERRLYGGAVRDARGASAVEHEIELAKEQQREQEDTLLTVMEDLEAHQREEERLLTEVEATRRQREADVAAWQQELTTLETHIVALKSDRSAKASGVPADTLQVYERLRVRKGGRAMASLQGTTCGVCRVTIPTNQVRKAHLSTIFCDNCGRILYAGR